MSVEGDWSTELSLCGQLRNGGQVWLPSWPSSVLSALLLAARFWVNRAHLASIPGMQQPPESSGIPSLPSHPPLTLPGIVLTGAIKGLCIGGRQWRGSGQWWFSRLCLSDFCQDRSFPVANAAPPPHPELPEPLRSAASAWAAPNCPWEASRATVLMLLPPQKTCGAPTWRRVRSWRSMGCLPQMPLA